MSDKSGSITASIAVGAVVIVLAVIFVALRFYMRITTHAGLKWDDWLSLLAVLLIIVIDVILLWASIVDPDGNLVAQTTDPNYAYTDADRLYFKLGFVTSVLYFTIAAATKMSILVMYNRIFASDVVFRRSLAVAGFLVAGWWIGCTVSAMTNCIPLKYVWVNSLPDPEYCFNYDIFWLASGACEIMIDLITLTLPIRAVLGLQLSIRSKVTVLCAFLLGGVVIITGIVKVVLGYIPGSWVPSYSNTEVWASVHTGMAIVCACLPVLWPLIKRISSSISGTKLEIRELSIINRRREFGEQSTLRGTRSRSQRLRTDPVEFGSEIAINPMPPQAYITGRISRIETETNEFHDGF